MSDRSLASQHPQAWTFHRATSRWPFNSVGANEDALPQAGREAPHRPFVRLPGPAYPSTTLAQCLSARASCRRFSGAALSLESLATLLHAAYGIKGRREFGALELLERAAPSGGGLYPLEVSVIAHRVDGIAPGVHHYVPVTHGLELLREVQLPPPLCKYLFMGQPWAADCAALIVLSAAFERSMHKYGDRGYRYLLLEAGHVGQNINLAAAALGLGCCNLGGFFDVDLAQLLGLEVGEELPVYAVAVGTVRGDIGQASVPE